MDQIREIFSLMGLGSWLMMGLVAGLVARFLLPGKDKAGCVSTVFIGIVGAVLGGVTATWLGFGGFSGFDFRSLVVATLGTVLLLLLRRVLGSRQEED